MYIEGGAVVRGAITARDAQEIAVRGRGLLDGSEWSHEKIPGSPSQNSGIADRVQQRGNRGDRNCK